ncbi:hypothetical protein LINGRAHAP2_LOCUS1018 [Linum grandiflorum]
MDASLFYQSIMMDDNTDPSIFPAVHTPVVKKLKQRKLNAIWERNVLPRTVEPSQKEVESTLDSQADHPFVTPTTNVVSEPSSRLIERDPGLRKSILSYPPDKRDEIRRAYLTAGPLQIRLSQFPRTGPSNRLRSFQQSW